MNQGKLFPQEPTWTPKVTRMRAGCARRIIDPPIGTRTENWGASKVHVTTGVHNHITATAMAILSENGESHFIVSIDWGWWQGITDDLLIRGAIIRELGINENQLLLHLTHTHAGPTTSSDVAELEGGQAAIEYHAVAIGEIVSACRQALAESVLVDVTWGYGKCALAVNRDLPCGSEDIVAFNPNQPADDTLAVARISDLNSKTIGIIINYACHPTTLAWDNSLASPDFVGAARDLIESKHDAPVLFLQGASGDLAPRDGFTGDTRVADKNGRVLGFATLSVIENMLPPSTRLKFLKTVESGALLGEWGEEKFIPERTDSFQRLDLKVPLKVIPSIEELEELWKNIDPNARSVRIKRAKKLREGYLREAGTTHPVWIWRFGKAIFVAHPGEAYSKFQIELRSRFPDRVVFVLNCTNGPGYVYVPTAESYDRGRYQVWQTLLGPGALDELIERVGEAIEAMN